MKIKLFLITVLFSTLSWGQAVLPVTRTVWNAGAPLGWTDGNATTPAYTSTVACSGSNAGRLDNNGEYYTVFFDSAPNQLSYSIRLTAVSTSTLLVEQSADGIAWTTIVNHSGIIGTACDNFNYTLLNTSRYVRWTYAKISQNLVIDNVNITKSAVTDAVDYCNLQSPANGTIVEGGVFNVYAQTYEPGVTEAAGIGTGISGWIGYSSANTDPSTGGWTWVPATFNVQVGNNDELVADIGSGLLPGTYYYASRFQLNGGPYRYGGYNTGFWDGTTNINGVLTVNPSVVDFANVQFPASGTISIGNNFDVYAQVYEPGVTEAAGAGAGITSWIGYNTTNNDPSTGGWTWVPATFNVQVGNNDEFTSEIGSVLPAGTYYYASRFQLGTGAYRYGGYNGGFWNGTTNVNGVLTVTQPVITISTPTLSGFTYFLGSGPSAEQTYTISGTNLIANITITAPTDYEISTVSGGPFSSSIVLTQTAGNVALTTIYVRLKSGLLAGNYNGQVIAATSTNATTQNVTCNGSVTVSNLTDIISAGGESATVSSLENDATITSVADGVQVWQFTIREGGVAGDVDNLPTIVNSIILSQNAGNQVNDWGDAIQAVALFNGATKIADGVVALNTITFTGAPIISVPDNGSVTLSLRLSVQTNPNNSGSNLDGDDFVFNITNTNVVADATASGFATFTSTNSTNGQNVLTVVATQLAFLQQPNTTGVNAAMTNVIVTATDSNGNVDMDFVSPISLTSTGTMTGSPIIVSAIAGVATYTSIIHTVIGTGYTMNATATGLTAANSNLFDIVVVTDFQKGDLAILAVNTDTGSGTDQIAFVCFQDILPGTTFYMTDNGYERQFAGEWGGTEGLISITRTGSTLPKGTIVIFQSTNGNVTDPSHYDIFTCGAIDANWTKTAISGGSIGGFNLNSDDDVWIMQGGVWTNSITHHSTYTGNVLYGWTESGWNTAPGGAGGDTRWSTVIPSLECYNTVAPTGPGKVKFNDPIDPDFSTTTNGQLDWIALINNTLNWDTYADNTLYNGGGYDYLGNASCPQMTIAVSGYVNGRWTGRVDTNWFNCGNWDTLVVPDETVDVQVGDNTFNNQAIVDATAPFAGYYGNIAKARNLTITGEKVEVTSNVNNILEVHGDLLIDAPAGALDMDDSTPAADGLLYLYGNWTNNMGNASFEEGNGTVTLTGTTPQIISNVTPEGTETFHNIILNNDFTTAISNDIIATGDLTVNATKTLVVSSNDYVQVTNNITNNGTLNVLNNGSLVQINDLGVNTGNISYERITTGVALDYVYWSSPVNGVSTPASGYNYTWNTTIANPNGGQGNWVSATNTAMQPALGYIMRGVLNRNFIGLPRNGVYTPTIARGSDIGAGSTGPNGIMRLATDDNWNLLGNPYPSAISINSFLTANTQLDGFVRLWTHGTLPSTAIADPFYDNFVSNYTASDYVAINGAGATSGPGTLSVIGAGQGFFVLMDAGPATTSTALFNNSMRDKGYSNSQFYRINTASQTTAIASSERHGIWLDLVSPTNETTRTLVAYVTDATYGRDRMFDAITDYKSAQNFYSIINEDVMTIQGRPVPFDNLDKVPMGVKIPSTGSYTIAIGAVDGIFASSTQDIYLEDLEFGIIHDLRVNPYSFNATQGIHNSRFVLRYTNSVLGNEDFIDDTNTVFVVSNESLTVSSLKENITAIEIYDVLGRKLYQNKNVNTQSQIVNSIQKTNSGLIIYITLENGKQVVKKAIY